MNNTRINAILKKIKVLYKEDEYFISVSHEDYDGIFNSFCLTFRTDNLIKAYDVFSEEEMLELGIDANTESYETYDIYINVDVDDKLIDINKQYIDNLINDFCDDALSIYE